MRCAACAQVTDRMSHERELLTAAESGSSAGVEAAIRAGANINYVDEVTCCQSMQAVCSRARFHKPLWLRTRVCLCVCVFQSGWSALKKAALHGHDLVVEYLLEHGAFANVPEADKVRGAALFSGRMVLF
jgi:hypothetical protein